MPFIKSSRPVQTQGYFFKQNSLRCRHYDYELQAHFPTLVDVVRQLPKLNIATMKTDSCELIKFRCFILLEISFENSSAIPCRAVLLFRSENWIKFASFKCVNAVTLKQHQLYNCINTKRLTAKFPYWWRGSFKTRWLCTRMQSRSREHRNATTTKSSNKTEIHATLSLVEVRTLRSYERFLSDSSWKWAPNTRQKSENVKRALHGMWAAQPHKRNSVEHRWKRSEGKWRQRKRSATKDDRI